jgi:hypothetical protein
VTAARRFRDLESGGKCDPHQRQLPVIEQMVAATRVMSALAALSLLPRYDMRPRWRRAKSLTMHVEHTAPVAMTDLGSASAEAAGSWTLILPVFLFRDPPYALRPCARLVPCNAMRCDAMSCSAQAKWGLEDRRQTTTRTILGPKIRTKARARPGTKGGNFLASAGLSGVAGAMCGKPFSARGATPLWCPVM